MNLIARIIKDWFTGSDGTSYDVGRMLWVASCIVFCVLACWTVIVNQQPFDPLGYGGGLAAVLAAGGAALGMKAKTEPKVDT